MPQATPYNPSKPQIRLRPENKLATTNFPNEIARVVNQNQALPKCGPVIDSASGGSFKSGTRLVRIVRKDGGAYGTRTTPSTWTYEVAELSGKPIGSSIPQLKRRANGRTNPADDDTYGIGGEDGKVFKLAIALGEYRGKSQCPP